MEADIRWKQRLQSFKKAVGQLKEFIEQPELNKFEKQGLIKCFEYTFELAWKTIKDYLEEQGFIIKSPRNAIQTAFQINIISDGHLWLEALEKRNLMSHTYNDNIADEAEKLIIERYYLMLNELFKFFTDAL